MRFRVAALTALFACAVLSPAHATDTLTLDDAYLRVLRTHPDLRVYAPRLEALQAERAQAMQSPALRLSGQVENAFGSGSMQRLRGSELTLSLASILERGGKYEARRMLVDRRIDALTVDQDAKRVDLLAETARRYLAIVVAGQRVAIAERDIAQRQLAVKRTRQRHRAGAVPESEVLNAQAAMARARLDRLRAEQSKLAARQYLAAMWGERTPDFEVVADSYLMKLPRLAEFRVLAKWLERSPEIRQFANEVRIREARLQLAESEASADIEWQVGVRQVRGINDYGVVAGISIPLGSSSRAQPGIRAARAELTKLDIQRESVGLSLYATLAAAHGRYLVARIEVEQLQSEVLPMLRKAAESAVTAYRSGAASYLEWDALQTRRIDARKRQLDAALEARRALIEIQRLTGRSFAVKPVPAVNGDAS